MALPMWFILGLIVPLVVVVFNLSSKCNKNIAKQGNLFLIGAIWTLYGALTKIIGLGNQFSLMFMVVGVLLLFLGPFKERELMRLSKKSKKKRKKSKSRK